MRARGDERVDLGQWFVPRSIVLIKCLVLTGFPFAFTRVLGDFGVVIGTSARPNAGARPLSM